MGKKDQNLKIEVLEVKDETALAAFLEKRKERITWKYRLNSESFRSIILSVNNAGGIVATLVRLPLKLRLGRGVVTTAALEGDLRVHPDYRGQGLARALMYHAEFGGSTITYGFSSLKLFRGFHQKMGLVEAPDRTIVYTKFRNPQVISKKIADTLGFETSTESTIVDPISIKFVLRGSTPFVLKIGRDRMELGSPSDTPMIIVRGDYFEGLSLFKGNPLRILFRIISRDIRFPGGIGTVVRLIPILRMLRVRQRVKRRTELKRDQ